MARQSKTSPAQTAALKSPKVTKKAPVKTGPEKRVTVGKDGLVTEEFIGYTAPDLGRRRMTAYVIPQPIVAANAADFEDVETEPVEEPVETAPVIPPPSDPVDTSTGTGGEENSDDDADDDGDDTDPDVYDEDGNQIDPETGEIIEAAVE